MEEVRLLGHEADDPPERLQLDAAHVDSVDGDRATVDVVQPRDQVGGRRLAAPRRPDQRHQLARRGVEADVGQREGLDRGRDGSALGLRRGRLGGNLELGGRHRVAERDVLEPDATTHHARRQVDGVGRIGDLVGHLEVLEDAVEQGQRALDLDLDVEQLAEREEEA